MNKKLPFFLTLLLLSSAAHADVIIGGSCSQLGVTTLTTDRVSIAACLERTAQDPTLIWKAMTGGQGTTGTIAYFALASCPEGWVEANGNNNTIDMRGVFPRGLDLGRGVDSGRKLGTYQSDAIRNITGNVGGTFHYNSYGSKPADGAFYHIGGIGGAVGQPEKDGWASTYFEASRVVPTATENRPVNVALLACQKK